jgi:hypothetical protein
MAITSTLSEMSAQVGDRLQDSSFVFWNEQYEVWGGLAEAITELMLIIGRPTQIFNQSVFLNPNTCFQPMPAGILAITDITISGKRLSKTTLHSLDYTCTSWGPAWESDRAPQPARWAPLGLSQFIVHPAPLTYVTAQFAGVSYPFVDSWPPNGTETSPFHKELNQALEMYAAAYCRTKEIGQDAEIGWQLYTQFLEIAQRLSVIEDRRDSLIWTRSIGAPTAPSGVSHR